ncbi:MAG: M13 family metallopeptidase [Ferruginibacter sp.]
MKCISFLFSAILLIFFSACSNDSGTSNAAAARTFFIDKAGMDSSVKPGDNFFLFANGNWVKSTKIPDDQGGWGAFYSIYEDNLKKMQGILEDEAKSNSAKGTNEQKVGDYYASGMDTVAIEKAGAEPLKPVLQQIDAVKDYKGLMNLVAELNAKGESYLLSFDVQADEKNSVQNIALFAQAGLSLPEKSYYTKTDSAATAARTALVKYAAKMFMLNGEDSAAAAKDAAIVLVMETEMAASHRSPEELRDPQKNYNKMALADLDKTEPNIGWKNYFDKLAVKADSVNVQQPGYYAALNTMLPIRSIDNWKAKLKFDYISSNAGLLGKAFNDARFQFGQVFNGQKKDSERWKKMVSRLDRGLGEILGQLFVKKYFTEAAKQRMDELVNNLQKAFEIRIKKLDWMSDATKAKAAVKLNAFLKKIGYPSKWKNYDDITINKETFFANAKSVQMHNVKEAVNKIGKPVDRTEWGMTPPTVNAYYNPTNNEIVFPAGILQFPFFDANADDAVNYGAIGMVIGHEMTHGFDDQGAQYDEVGNMKNWWAKDDSIKFVAKTGGVVKQYNAFKMFDSLHVNGSLTLGENLADIGGIAIAYDAFKLTKQGKDTVKIDGLTPDQRFFLGFAMSWREVDRPEIQRVWLNTDPHSPALYRVNGPLSNFQPFYTTFNIGEGDKMYIKPEDRAKIW